MSYLTHRCECEACKQIGAGGPMDLWRMYPPVDLVDPIEENAPLVMSTGKERWRWSWRKGRWWLRSFQPIDRIFFKPSKL